ncbi:hypothetical protein KIW84_062209 [Lathyrus oleraceus]|uniref:Retrovirus-related Pol polyprotein from transposon TNT 1-94-like beta-barrel domain-containing protein n=1 Tax=Pisum sativum TaxID=3888 RepID=A0A9D4W572_PEA|nr:hypothetical protein KIW84_062209 [Pisum sativum]
MVCHVKEEIQPNLWYLDTGCSNHMCGDKKAFSDLDESFRSIVKFGDNSIVSVMGKGTIGIHTKKDYVQTISNVLFVPDLKTNLLSVGQLQEKGYGIYVKNGVCRIEDEKLGLIAQVNITANRMFPLYLQDNTQSCLSASRDVVFDEEATWSWKEDEAKQYIPIACDDNEEREKPMQNVQVVEGNQNVPIADRSPLVAESQRPQRHRRRPAWMEDYEVTGVDQAHPQVDLAIILRLTRFPFSPNEPTLPSLLSNITKKSVNRLTLLSEILPCLVNVLVHVSPSKVSAT